MAEEIKVEENKEIDTKVESPKVNENKQKVSLVSKMKNSKFFLFRLFTNYFFGLLFFTLTSIFSGFILFLLDKSNYLRPSSLTISGLINMFNTNVGAFIWFICTVIFIFMFVGLLSYAIFNNIKEAKLVKIKNPDQYKKTKNKYAFLIFLLIFVLCGIALLLVIFFFPWRLVKAEFDQKTMDVKNVGLSLVMLLVSVIVSTIVTFGVVSLGYTIKLGISKLDKEQHVEENKEEVKPIEEEIVENVVPISPVGPEEYYKRNNKISIFSRNKLIFPYLCKIDERYYYTKINKSESNNVIDLKAFVIQFQSYLAKNKYYFDLKVLRAFIAGMNASRIILLEGLSGTGKSTLPRMFENYIGGKCHFYPVQATWRDRSDVVGYYSDFTKKFKESEFLKVLYEANYKANDVNLMVLDEMNISRVEYYFADFLSILEYPKEDWLVPLVNDCNGIILPERFEDGKIRIPDNTWFVGTINIDDSTFSISDKVYDRAMVIDFVELSHAIKCDVKSEPWPITNGDLVNTFKNAMNKEDNYLDDKGYVKFIKLCEFFSETFGVRFGNRIAQQIEKFLPVYVELGGSKEEALDYIFATKILRKVDGRFENYILVGLNKLYKYIQTVYGKDKFKETEAHIDNLRKKLS